MSINRMRRRLEALEALAWQRSGSEDKARLARIEAAELAAAEALLGCLPESRQEAVGKLLVPGEGYWTGQGRTYVAKPVLVDNPGLESLRFMILRGMWALQPLPVEVVDVFLADPEAEPRNRCDCGLWLPIKWGMWERQGRSWQGPVVHFEACPGCGAAVPYRKDYNHLPLRPRAGWAFESDKARWRHQERQ